MNHQNAELIGRGRPRIAAAQRREAILTAAREAFIELGFAGTSTVTIATKARVSKRSIYEVFTDKTALFAAVIHDQQGLILDLPRPDGEMLPLLDSLICIFRLDIDEEAHRAREAILHLIARESMLFPELSDYLYDNQVIRSRDALIEWLDMESRRGRIVIEDMAVCAGMLMDIVFGALLPRRRTHAPGERALRINHIVKRLELFLRATTAQTSLR